MRGTRKLTRALHEAILAHDLDTVMTLLTSNDPELDINFEFNGKTALLISLQEGNFRIAQVFNTISFNFSSFYSVTPELLILFQLLNMC